MKANETGGSYQIELEGAKRECVYLQSPCMAITVLSLDCLHFFDVWDVTCSFIKAMLKLGKEKGCGQISDWLKGAQNHLYMCATSTRLGFGELIMAKWKSFMRHVANKHDDHPSLFKQCDHEKEIERRRWIKIGIL